MEEYHAIANEMNLTAEQRSDYFSLGAEVQNRKTVKLGFGVCAEYTHKLAMGALIAGNWNAETAKAILKACRDW